jgi:hypothetical protein
MGIFGGNQNSGRKPQPKEPKPVKTCPICGQPLTSRQHYCTPAHKQKGWRERKKNNNLP